MSLFRQLFFVALCAGTLSGVVITAAHQVGSVPIILEAEVFEKAAEAKAAGAGPAPVSTPAPAAASTPAASAAAALTTLAHDHAQAHDHDHAAPAWEPEDGLERTLYTGLADVLTGIGFALLLVCGYALSGTAVDWRKGLFWGLAGFATFTLAPGLGLPPEVPGTEAAPLLDRQIWWIATVAATGGGLALIAFSRQALWVGVAVLLIVLPHLIGAPQPLEHVSAAPESLAHRFIVAATVTSLLFWACLGVSTGALFQRLLPRAA